MTLWSWALVAALAGPLPLLSARGMRAAARAGMTRGVLYTNACASQWLLAAMGYLVVRLDGQGLGDVGVRVPEESPWWLPGWSAGLAAAALAILVLTRRGAPRSARDAAALDLLVPEGRGQTLALVLLVAPTAGLCEEFLYRGFLISRLREVVGGPLQAALLAAAAFGAGHLYQGRIGAARAGVIGLLLSAPFLLDGSVLPSMAAHALVDAIGLAWVVPLLRRRGGLDRARRGVL